MHTKEAIQEWEGRKVFVDPFVKIEYFYEVDPLEDGILCVTPRCRILQNVEDAETFQAIFPYGALKHFVLRFFVEPLEEKWAFHHPHMLEGEKKKLFLKECETHIVWKNPPIKKDPTPILVLKDRTGAFADLWMEDEDGRYPTHGRTLFPAEKFWEKDLLETDFIKKIVGTSHYYCPLDKVMKSLSFLLELGWTLLDFKERKIVKQKEIELEQTETQDRIVISGKVSYGEHKADISTVVGAFNRREQFIDLSPHEVGLIELPPTFGDLSEEEIIGGAIHVKKTHLGLLEGISPTPALWESTSLGPDFSGSLYPYQQKGVDFLSYLYRSNFHGLLADEMGLGKTVQILAFLSTLTPSHPILIVMPTSLLFNWKNEIQQFLPSWKEKIILTSYARLRLDLPHFLDQEYEAVILDEAQTIKNPDSQIAQAVCRLKSRFRLAVTGTPIENRWEDLQSIFRFLMRDALTLSTVIERARKQIRPFTLRRKKEEVALDLPDRIEQLVWVEFEEEQRGYYENWLKDHKASTLSATAIFEAILRLRQICAHPQLVNPQYPGKSAKFDRLMADLEEVLSTGAKVLVYSQFTSMLSLIEKEVQNRGWKYVYLDGQTRDRETPIRQFQEDPAIQIFLISLKAGGVGINLTAADYVFLFDPWWNEAVEEQAISRAHRLRRKKTVISRRYLSAQTIEEKILKLKQKKLALAQAAFDFESDISALTLEELQELLQE